MSLAVATSKLTRSDSPCVSAWRRASTIDGSWKSKPTKRLLGNAWAISSVEKPTPQPMSATFAPAFSLSCMPSRAGSQFWTMLFTYPGRKKAPVAQNRQPA